MAQLPAHRAAVYSLAFSPDGSRLAAAGFERKVRMYDPQSHELVGELEGPDTDLRSVAFSPDGTQLAAAGRNGKIRVWTMPTGEVRQEVAAGTGRIRTLAWLPDGQKLVSAGESRMLQRLGRRRRASARASSTAAPASCCRWSSVEKHLIATGGSDNVVRVWNWQTQTEADGLLGHTGSVASLAFDPSSRTIISGSYDTTVRVWRLRAAGGGAGHGRGD